MISTFENISNIVNDKIKVKSESVAITNKDLHEQINNLDNTLESLQKSLNHFKMRDDIYLINLSSTYKFLLDDFENKLNRWRSRRTKTHSYQEAKADTAVRRPKTSPSYQGRFSQFRQANAEV